jgi:cytochrome bd-type quinol oxidase subunit 2
MLTHLRIQQVLGLVVLILTIAVHFTVRVVPAFDGSWRTFDPLRAMPYAVGIVTAVLVLALRHDRQKAYAAFLCNSPGVAIDTAGVRYGTGHPVDKP